MAQPPPPTGSAAARSALAQKLSGVPPDYFVIKLYQMLQEPPEILKWYPNGGIIIHDRERLEARLSRYFWHNRLTSFQRQLNNFGFHITLKTSKQKAEAGFVGTATQLRKMAVYSHPLLVGQQPEAVRDPVSVEASRRYRDGASARREHSPVSNAGPPPPPRPLAKLFLSAAVVVDYSITINAARSSRVEDGP